MPICTRLNLDFRLIQKCVLHRFNEREAADLTNLSNIFKCLDNDVMIYIRELQQISLLQCALCSRLVTINPVFLTQPIICCTILIVKLTIDYRSTAPFNTFPLTISN